MSTHAQVTPTKNPLARKTGRPRVDARAVTMATSVALPPDMVVRLEEYRRKSGWRSRSEALREIATAFLDAWEAGNAAAGGK